MNFTSMDYSGSHDSDAKTQPGFFLIRAPFVMVNKNSHSSSFVPFPQNHDKDFFWSLTIVECRFWFTFFVVLTLVLIAWQQMRQ